MVGRGRGEAKGEEVRGGKLRGGLGGSATGRSGGTECGLEGMVCGREGMVVGGMGCRTQAIPW